MERFAPGKTRSADFGTAGRGMQCFSFGLRRNEFQNLARRMEGFTIRRMKRSAPFVLLATVVLVVLTPLLAATAAPAAAKDGDRSPVAPIATAISTVTGI